LNKIDIAAKLALFSDHWRPKVVAQLKAEVIVFEPAETCNTGNLVGGEFTAPQGVRI
jgi:hypothetical protein